MSKRSGIHPVARRAARGFSLIEMMIAMVLGLLVVGAAIGIFVSNQQAYRATEGLGRVQENVRMAFEMMARTVRESGGNPCNSTNSMPLINVLNNPANNWWSRWGVTPANAPLGSALVGFAPGAAVDGLATGAAAGQRVAGTPALVVISAEQRAATVVSHTPSTQSFVVQNANHGFQTGDLLVVCGQDSDVVSLASVTDAGVGTVRLGGLFQMSNAGGGTTIRHAIGGSTPGNASANLGPAGTEFTFGANATISRVQASVWYVGNAAAPAVGSSLYQRVLGPNGAMTTQEIIQGVQAMNLAYLLPGANAYVAADAVPAARWGEVAAVRIELTLQGTQNVDGAPITRQLVQVANLRNRSL